jgi:hypothetical protein
VNKYSLTNTNAVVLDNQETYTRIEGLQISLDYNASGSDARAIYDEAGYTRISYNIIRDTIGNAQSGYRIGINSDFSRIWNNIIYGFRSTTSTYGEGISCSSAYVYNNTIFDCNLGIMTWDSNVIAINNLIASTTDPYYSTFGSGTDYNATDINDTPGQGTHNRTSQVFSFVDPANKDFHLSASDVSAKNFGTSLSGDANLSFATDIDGTTRPTGSSWDIGADEEVGGSKPVFYSVGQNTSDHKTGSPTMSISNGGHFLHRPDSHQLRRRGRLPTTP